MSGHACSWKKIFGSFSPVLNSATDVLQRHFRNIHTSLHHMYPEQTHNTHTQEEVALSSSSSLNLHIASFIEHYHHHDHRPTLHGGHKAFSCTHIDGPRVEFGVHSILSFVFPLFLHPGLWWKFILNNCPHSSSRTSSLTFFFLFFLSLFFPYWYPFSKEPQNTRPLFKNLQM